MSNPYSNSNQSLNTFSKPRVNLYHVGLAFVAGGVLYNLAICKVVEKKPSIQASTPSKTTVVRARDDLMQRESKNEDRKVAKAITKQEIISTKTDDLGNEAVAKAIATDEMVATLKESQPPQNNFSGVMARPYDSWPTDTPFPCYPPTETWNMSHKDEFPIHEGFLFLRPAKVGSSTTSGVTLRVARNIAKRQNKKYPICRASFQHDAASKKFPQREAKPKSFLWSILREPTSRATSMFFHFEVARRKVEPTDSNFQDYLLRQRPNLAHDYYIDILKTGAKYARGRDDPLAIAQSIMQEYDMIGITERMDDSLVVLMMVLNLKMADILYVSAKTNGGYDDGLGRETEMCTYILKSFVSPGMKEFFETSEEWSEFVKYDTALFKAANRSLDMTIDRLGRTKFEVELNRFRDAKKEVAKQCGDSVIFPCNADGKFIPQEETDCMWGDLGCGMECLDKVSTELKLW